MIRCLGLDRIHRAGTRPAPHLRRLRAGGRCTMTWTRAAAMGVDGEQNLISPTGAATTADGCTRWPQVVPPNAPGGGIEDRGRVGPVRARSGHRAPPRLHSCPPRRSRTTVGGAERHGAKHVDTRWARARRDAVFLGLLLPSSSVSPPCSRRSAGDRPRRSRSGGGGSR
jgi:hypothetical protein